MYPSETVRELCERCLVNPLENNPPKVSWANTNLLLSERLTHLNSTKPWQLKLAKGEEELLVTVPAGVEIRSEPLRSRRASGADGEGAATAPTFSKSPADPVRAAPGFEAAEAAEASAAAALTEHAAAGLMAVAAGPPAQKKRGRGRPRKYPEQRPSTAKRDVPPMRGGGFPGASGGVAASAALNPALLAAYEAGRADAAAAAAGMRTANVSTAARATPPTVADMIDTFYTRRPSTTAETAFPLDSLRAAAGDGLAGAGAGRCPTAASAPAGAASFSAGSAANDKALWQWNQTLAMLSGQVGHPAGAYVDLSSPYASLFAPPSAAAELHRLREANEHALSEVSPALEEVRLAAAAMAAEGDGADPSARAALVAKVERVLRAVDERKSRIPLSQRADIAKNVLELRAWVKTQLQARIKELATRAWEPESQAAARDSKAAAKDTGRSPAPAEETPAFSLRAAVAAASDGERGAFPAISSDGDPTEA